MTMDAGAPILWPEGDTHTVEYAPLDPAVPDELRTLVPAALRLAKLGDALRSLQATDGSPIAADASQQLADTSARLLGEMAETAALPDETKDIIRLRADALANGTEPAAVALREAEASAPQPLTVLCGPLCTWRQKSKVPLHGVVVAARHEPSDRLMAAIDERAAQALATVETRLGLSGLDVAGVYPIQVVDLIACGGEPNTFPKHFAYFLPEDEGITDRDTPNKKTILFRNGYRLRFTQISDRLAQKLLDGPRVGEGVDVAPPLLSWLRGHDIAHGVTIPGMGKVGSPEVGHEPWMALQEAISDVFGLLMALTPEWLELLPEGGADDVAAIFMGELLHYLRRGPWLWGDAGAAYVELSFLEQGGYVEIDDDARVHWSTERLIEGMDAMAKELVAEVVTAPDGATVHRFLDRHSWKGESGAVRVVEALRTRVASVPTALAYA